MTRRTMSDRRRNIFVLLLVRRPGARVAAAVDRWLKPTRWAST